MVSLAALSMKLGHYFRSVVEFCGGKCELMAYFSHPGVLL